MQILERKFNDMFGKPLRNSGIYNATDSHRLYGMASLLRALELTSFIDIILLY